MADSVSNDREAPQIWTCDCCSSWTDRPVTISVLLDEWGWTLGSDDEDLPAPLYCPQCQ